MYQLKRRKLSPGEGIIKLGGYGATPTFHDLEFSYPLKLIAPSRHFTDQLACLYMISYGGGLVANDVVKLDVEVTDGSSLVLLTQGSTKVFQTRKGIYPTASTPAVSVSAPTLQHLTARLHPLCSLYLLPAPITCFSLANYSQSQTFHIASDSNLLLLDWYTSGRMGMRDQEGNVCNEEWDFLRYRSANEIFMDGKRIVRDVLLLEDETPRRESTTPTTSDGPGIPHSASYKPLVDPYSCYCTLFIFGPTLQPLLQYFQESFSQVSQYNIPNPYDLIWSFSPLEKGQGGVVRCAGASTERVRDWLKDVLEKGGIIDVLGSDLWQNAL